MGQNFSVAACGILQAVGQFDHDITFDTTALQEVIVDMVNPIPDVEVTLRGGIEERDGHLFLKGFGQRPSVRSLPCPAGKDRYLQKWEGVLPCPAMDTPNDLIPAEQARLEHLHVSPKKMAAMLKDGTIRHYPNPLDKRQKLVSRAEVLALLPKRAEAA